MVEEEKKEDSKLKKFGKSIAKGIGTAIYKIRNREPKEVKHTYSKNQFNKLVWIGLVYYLLQWFYKLILGIDVFSKLPYEFMLINLAIALIVLALCFKPSTTEFFGTSLLIIIYILVMLTGLKFNIPLMGGELGTIFTLCVMTVFIALIWQHFLHADISGMIGVSMVFLLEIGIKIFFANIILLGFLIDIFLHAPYWFLLGIFAGGYVEGGPSKLIGVMRSLTGIIIIIFIAFNLLSLGTTYGATKFSISEEKKSEGRESFKDSWENFKLGLKKTTAPLFCIGDPMNWDQCIAEKSAPPKKPLTEEEKMMAIPYEKKPKKIDLYFNNIDSGKTRSYEENKNYQNIRILTQLKGESLIDKDILLACSINEIEGKITYPKSAETTIVKDDLSWWQDVECQPPMELKTKNEVEFLARFRQKVTTIYPNYFMPKEELNSILEEYKTAEYVENEKNCQYLENRETCLKNLRKTFYSKIPEFEKIKNDYPNFEMLPKYDDETAGLIIENTAVSTEPIIGIENEKSFRLRFAVLNNAEGEIVNIESVKINIPDFVNKQHCTILDEEGNIKKTNLDLIDWKKVEPNEKKMIPGICQLDISNVKDFIRVEITSEMEFDYQIKGNFNIYLR